MTDTQQAMLEDLANAIGPAHVLDDPQLLELHSRDVWSAGEPPVAIARPADTRELVEIVNIARSWNCSLTPRGGGMSYTGGYTRQEPAILVCTRRMDRVLEINERDMTVTVQAGCTWAQLHEALQMKALRTPYWGPLSGRFATVGGSVSQNSIFWGGSRHGCAADSVVSVEVVLASGEVLRTGSAAQQHGSPFYRHFGPDLTGLFCCDCGALGLKATITLRLLPDNQAREFLSFDFADHRALLDTMAEVARQDLASECFGFDPLLTEMRARRDSLMADAKSLGNVLASASSIRQAASDTLGILAGGRRFMQSLAWPLHVIVEERNSGAAKAVAAQVASIAAARGASAVPNSIPKIMRSNPFGPVNNMIGPGGERWVPVHGLLPLSRAAEATEAITAIFARHQDAMERYQIRTGFLYNSVAGHCIAVEPLFFWPDPMESIHRHSIEESFYKRVPKLEHVPGARDAVARIRQAIADRLSEMGASHLQLGRSYHYADALEGPARELVTTLKRQLDPDNLINPGVLGLGLEASDQ